jgi:hypothetical protein
MTIPAGPHPDPARNRNELRAGIGFAGSMLAIALLSRFAVSFGWTFAADLAYRASMALPGAFFVLTGNAVPKTLTPLAVMKRNPARVQAFRRFAGWVWVLTGVAYSLAWLSLPTRLAVNATLLVVPAGMLLVALGWLRLRSDS